MNITHHKNGEIKTLVDEAPYHPGYEDAGFKPKEINNEPVAWMRTNKQWRKEVSWVKKEGFDIPLYTHPVKELTDEKIIKTMVQFDVYSSDDHCLIEAGRAILRKAQEK